MTKIIAQNKSHLKKLIKEHIDKYGNNCDLNMIDICLIKNLRNLFKNSQFNGSIENWDTSNVENMSGMFMHSSFNGDISRWDTSKVKDMSGMFDHANFNGDINRWDVSHVIDMSFMFNASQFNGDISNWDVRKTVDMNFMFADSLFTQNLNNWTPFSLETKIEMFGEREKPYWFFYEKKQERNQAIKEYLSKIELKDKLLIACTHKNQKSSYKL